MSEVNLALTVNSFQANMTVDTNTINLSPNPVNMVLYAGGIGVPANASGGNTQVQFNDNGVMGGSNNFTYNKNTGVTSIVTGTISTLNATNGTVTGNLVSNVSNITTGNVTTLTVTNSASIHNFTGSGNVNLGSVGNLEITGGTNQDVLTTDGAGNLTWSAIPIAVPAGTTGKLQFNNAGNFGALTSANYDAALDELTLGTLANLKIEGGVNGYFIQTDGTGNLSWVAGGGTGNGTVGGSNTQVQFNDAGAFGGNIFFSFDKTTLTLNSNNASFSQLMTSGNASITYNIGVGGSANITGSANILAGANIGGNLNALGNLNVSTLANVTGNLTVAGTSNLNGATNLNGLTTLSNTTNVTGLLNVTNTATVQQAKEKTTIVGTVPPSTTQYDALSQAIVYYTTAMTGNVTVNIRGNSTTTFNSITSTGETMTLVLMTTTGSTPYTPTTFQIDGSTIVPKWTGGIAPSVSTVSSNSVAAYSYTIVKTGSSAYTVLGSFTGFK